MEEIKVGDYVRTIDGKIDKVIEISGKYILLKNNLKITEFIENRIYFKIKDIVKHSPNIIDLIEEGDYVNGDEVIAIDYTEDEKGNYINVLGIMEIDDDYAYPIELRVLNIKSIVTKEQFESIKYEV